MGNVYTNFEDSGGAGRCKGSYVFVYSPKLDTVGRVNAGNRIKVPHKPVQTALIYTMNCPEELSHKVGYDTLLGFTGTEMERLYGYNEILCSYEILQFKDHSRYDMNLFSEEQRKERHETQFPVDLKKAYDLGSRLSQQAKKTQNI